MTWFFALIHYARWVPVHIRDMTGLHVLHPNVATKFQNGHFFGTKTLNAFSSLPIDHAHEQNNNSVKGDRGAIGLTENMFELLRWIVSGGRRSPAVACWASDHWVATSSNPLRGKFRH